MKMSDAMTALGYGALPNGPALIIREQQREAEPKQLLEARMTTEHYPDFTFYISRSLEGLGDQEIELAIQVTHYRPASEHKSWIDHRDPAYSPPEVQFGDAVVVSTGKTIELTELEWEAVESAFWTPSI